jgi:biopolymer transport protein TolQ
MFRSRLSAIERECVIFAGQLLNRMRHEAAAHRDGLRFAGEKPS